MESHLIRSNSEMYENVPMLNYPFPNNAYNWDIQPLDATPRTLPVFGGWICIAFQPLSFPKAPFPFLLPLDPPPTQGKRKGKAFAESEALDLQRVCWAPVFLLLRLLSTASLRSFFFLFLRHRNTRVQCLFLSSVNAQCKVEIYKDGGRTLQSHSSKKLPTD